MSTGTARGPAAPGIKSNLVELCAGHHCNLQAPPRRKRLNIIDSLFAAYFEFLNSDAAHIMSASVGGWLTVCGAGYGGVNPPPRA